MSSHGAHYIQLSCPCLGGCLCQKLSSVHLGMEIQNLGTSWREHRPRVSDICSMQLGKGKVIVGVVQDCRGKCRFWEGMGLSWTCASSIWYEPGWLHAGEPCVGVIPEEIVVKSWSGNIIRQPLYVEFKKKWYKWTYLQNRKRLTDLENKLKVAEGKGWLGTLGRSCTYSYVQW